MKGNLYPIFEGASNDELRSMRRTITYQLKSRGADISIRAEDNATPALEAAAVSVGRLKARLEERERRRHHPPWWRRWGSAVYAFLEAVGPALNRWANHLAAICRKQVWTDGPDSNDINGGR